MSEGCYLLRSNVTDWSDEDLWKAYIQLTEAEAAFRIHKSDLVLRPIWHQKEERVLAHILVCFLAYVLWKTLGADVASGPGWAMSRGGCSRSWARSSWLTWCSPRVKGRRFAAVASRSPRTTKRSCWRT